MRYYYDENGRYRGRSHGAGIAALKGFFAVFALAMLFGWPLLIHGPAGVALEVIWVILGVIVLAVWGASKAAPEGQHHGKLDEEDHERAKPAILRAADDAWERKMAWERDQYGR